VSVAPHSLFLSFIRRTISPFVSILTIRAYSSYECVQIAYLIKQGKQDTAAASSITDTKNKDKLGDVLNSLISDSLSLACHIKATYVDIKEIGIISTTQPAANTSGRGGS
jgi:hypothetical protein